MAGRIDARIAALGLSLPDAPSPAANYVGATMAGPFLFISGQGPAKGDGFVAGKAGAALSVEEGREAARLVALALIAHMKAALGDLDRVVRIVKLFGMVNAAPDFTEHPAVINGASDLMVEVFGEAGRHARSAVGMASLPVGIAVEIEAVVEIAPADHA